MTIMILLACALVAWPIHRATTRPVLRALGLTY